MEFHTTVPTTGVDIPGMIVDHILAVARRKTDRPALAPMVHEVSGNGKVPQRVVT
jgi:hypothetical protein